MSKEFTFLMPCLNEERTIGDCIKAIKESISKECLDAEILVVDNGSTDRSSEIALSMGARVVFEQNKGYGSALIRGIKEAEGKYTIMGDCDMSYDFSSVSEFVKYLRLGADLVMGNRFAGGIEKGAMPWSHRYIGNPLISLAGRIICKSKIGDFCCGLRGFDTERMRKVPLRGTGMEFSVEMVVAAEKAKYLTINTPIILHPDGRDRKPHLNTFKDGLRILRYYLSVLGNTPVYSSLGENFLFLGETEG